MTYLAIAGMLAGALLAQTAAPPARRTGAPDPASTAKLLESGRCADGLPRARRAYAATADAGLRKRLAASGIRCAMTLNKTSDAAALIELVARDYPRDPDVLYLAVHTFSDLSVRASQELLFAHPDAYQVHQLNAEALETQGKWDEAAEEYRVVLSKNPELPGIHYRLGRILLSKPETPTTKTEARKEFEEELRINPANAGAEFVLAELARQDGNNDEAIERFSRAAKLDAAFVDAYIGLGRSLLAAGKSVEAIAPLETAAKLQPANPMPHFQLATAYRRNGRLADADREFQVYKAASDKARQTTDDLKKAVSGSNERNP